jgi:hypothetical protein
MKKFEVTPCKAPIIKNDKVGHFTCNICKKPLYRDSSCFIIYEYSCLEFHLACSEACANMYILQNC